MGIKFLSLDNQFVPDFTSHEKNDHFFFFNIIQCPQVPRTQLELGKRIGAQSFNRLRRRCGLVFQARQDGRF